MRSLVCLIIAVALCACSREEDLFQKFSSPEDRAIAQSYIDHLRAHDFRAIEDATDPPFKTPALRGTLERMAGLMPSTAPTSMKLVGAHTLHTPGATTVNTTFEYNFGDTWLLANVAVRDTGGVKTIVAFNITPQPQSLEAQHRFSLAGKGGPHYLVLVAALTAALLTAWALIVCLRTKRLDRKWLWILFISCGFGQVAINWTTGQWRVAPLAVQLFSASANAPPYGPWTVSASLPIGAIVYLFYRRRRFVQVVGS